MRLHILIAALLLLALGVATASPAGARCATGAYRHGATIAVLTEALPDKDTSPKGGLRLTTTAGTVGILNAEADGGFRGSLWTMDGRAEAAIGSKSCTADRFDIVIGKDAPVRWTRIALRESPVRFTSDGVALAGRLVEPDQRVGPALAVLVHGSENFRAIGVNPMPYLLAAQGVAALVYDKRGTGSSQGHYSQNFDRLARDAAAASATARSAGAGRYRRIGLFGASQGGWVAPLAATLAPVDFVAVGYGLIETPLGEDAEQVADELRRKGYGPITLAKARRVTDATGAIVASHFTAGFERLEALKQRYAGEAWLGAFEGEYSGPMLRETPAALKAEGRARYDNLDINWHHDAFGVLKRLSVPQLWVMAVEDIDAPSAHSIQQLRQLKRAGKPIDLVVYPDADHGMRQYRVAPDGRRTRTHYVEGYFQLLADWMKGTMTGSYGRSVVERAGATQ